jgi:predicted phosphohydrolase
MRIYVLSDLHLEYYGNRPQKLWRALTKKLSYLRQREEKDGDDDDEVMCLCGDIGWPLNQHSRPSRQFRDLLAMFVARFPRTFLIAGNHEFFGRRGSKLEDVVSALRQLANETGVVFLDRDRIELDGVTFLGCILWSRTTYRDFAAMNDSRMVFSSHQHNLDTYGRDRFWLEEQLDSLAPDSKVIVTRSLGTRATPRTWRASWLGRSCACGFAAICTNHVNSKSVTCWLSGRRLAVRKNDASLHPWTRAFKFDFH